MTTEWVLVQNAVYALCGPFSKPKPPQEPVSEIASHGCHYLAFPDRICNKCGRIHGYHTHWTPIVVPSNAAQGERG